MSKVVILDNGHGKETAGKRSPIWGDGSQLFEWEFNRDIVRRIAAMLKADGVKFEILVPEETDVSLPERCRRANVIHADCGNNAVLFSVHGNAGGGTGWECYTSVGQTKRMQSQPYFVMRRKKSLPRMVGKCALTIPTATRTKKTNFTF